MKPPYELTAAILNGLSEVSEKVGALKAFNLERSSHELPRQSKGANDLADAFKVGGSMRWL